MSKSYLNEDPSEFLYQILEAGFLISTSKQRREKKKQEKEKFKEIRRYYEESGDPHAINPDNYLKYGHLK